MLFKIQLQRQIIQNDYRMQCRNYMEQYSRTKSIREINKTRASYKQLLQNSKTRDTSNTHTNLKLSAQKRCSEKIDKNVNSHNCYAAQNYNNTSSKNETQVLSNTQNIQNFTNVNYGKLNSKMKIKVAADKSIRSMSSHQQLKNHSSFVASSMANIGVGLGSQKKKPKLVTLGSNQNHTNSTTKKEKVSIDQSFCQMDQNYNDKSRSISKSHNNSVVNSKYSTNMAHQAAYLSVKKQMSNNNNIEIVTINTSLLLKQPQKDNDGSISNTGLQKIYKQIKSVIQDHQQQSRQWQIQRAYYIQRIKQLQKQLQQANGKSSNKKAKGTFIQSHHCSSVNLNSYEEVSQSQKSSNRKISYNHR